MSAARKDAEEDALYRVTLDTLPPEGEDDAYSAPTKVGPMARAAIGQMVDDTAAPVMKTERVTERPAPPQSEARAIAKKIVKRDPVSTRAPVGTRPVLPRLYDEFDEADPRLDPTSLFGASRSAAAAKISSRAQSGETKLLRIPTSIPVVIPPELMAAMKYPLRIDIPARIPDAIIVVRDEVKDPPLLAPRVSTFRFLVGVFCVIAIGAGSAWLLLVP